MRQPVLVVATLWLAAPAPAEQGASLYAEHCAECHGPDGRANTVTGRVMRVPTLEDPKWSAPDSGADVIAAVREMAKHEAVASVVSDAELRAIAAHLRGLLGTQHQSRPNHDTGRCRAIVVP